MGSELLQSLIPRERSLFDLSGGSLEVLTCRAVFILPDQSLPGVKSLFRRHIYLKREKSEAVVAA